MKRQLTTKPTRGFGVADLASVAGVGLAVHQAHHIQNSTIENQQHDTNDSSISRPQNSASEYVSSLSDGASGDQIEGRFQVPCKVMRQCIHITGGFLQTSKSVPSSSNGSMSVSAMPTAPGLNIFSCLRNITGLKNRLKVTHVLF